MAQEKPKRELKKLGGSRFPRTQLAEAIICARRLVSKAHTGPISKDIYYSGVLHATGSTGDIKSSSLKQYGLSEGSVAEGYRPSELAKKINTAEGAELNVLLGQAALSPKIFSALFETFHGDAVPRSRLKQRAHELDVHPEVLDQCIEVYAKSLKTAGLLTEDGERLHHVAAVQPAQQQVMRSPDLEEQQRDDDTESQDEHVGSGGQSDEGGSTELEPKAATPQTLAKTSQDLHSKTEDLVPQNTVERSQPRPRGQIQVTIAIDSSLDTDKLAKQLELLKKYGAL